MDNFIKNMVNCYKINDDKFINKFLIIFTAKQFETIKVNNNMIDYGNCATLT